MIFLIEASPMFRDKLHGRLLWLRGHHLLSSRCKVGSPRVCLRSSWVCTKTVLDQQKLDEIGSKATKWVCWTFQNHIILLIIYHHQMLKRSSSDWKRETLLFTYQSGVSSRQWLKMTHLQTTHQTTKRFGKKVMPGRSSTAWLWWSHPCCQGTTPGTVREQNSHPAGSNRRCRSLCKAVLQRDLMGGSRSIVLSFDNGSPQMENKWQAWEHTGI